MTRKYGLVRSIARLYVISYKTGYDYRMTFIVRSWDVHTQSPTHWVQLLQLITYWLVILYLVKSLPGSLRFTVVWCLAIAGLLVSSHNSLTKRCESSSIVCLIAAVFRLWRHHRVP